MADRSAIEWTDASWNPVRAQERYGAGVGWHCEHVSEGCRNCYAERMNKRLGTGADYKPAHRKDLSIFVDEKMLLAPLRWKRPRMIFVGSMTDLFADFVTDDMLDRIFAVMALCPQHVFQVLTKRSARMRRYIGKPRWPNERLVALLQHWCEAEGDLGFLTRRATDATGGNEDRLVKWPLANVWLGVSAEDQATADARIPDLLETPAAVRWVSAEPLLGMIDLNRLYREVDGGREQAWESALNGRRFDPWGDRDIAGCPRLDWVVVGGESGPGARPVHSDWAQSIRDQCKAAGVPFFFKQWGEWIDADQWLDLLNKSCKQQIFERDLSTPWSPPRPLNFVDAEVLARVSGKPFEHQSDGTTTIRVGKKAADRLLDGVLHDAMPARVADLTGGERP